MPYDDKDLSIQSGSPIHLLQFIINDVHYRYTNRPAGITAIGETWEYANFKFGDIEISEDINKNNLEIEFHHKHPFVEIYRTHGKNNQCDLTLWRGHEGETDYIAYWSGRALNIERNLPTVTVNCESDFTSGRRDAALQKQSVLCPYTIYDDDCTLNPQDGDELIHYGIINAVSDDYLTLTIEAATERAPSFFRRGKIVAEDGIKRTILTHSGPIITLARPHVGFTQGSPVTLFGGCTNNPAACIAKNNILNYGGARYLKNNPMNGYKLQ